jgi:hypothetical protein
MRTASAEAFFHPHHLPVKALPEPLFDAAEACRSSCPSFFNRDRFGKG